MKPLPYEIIKRPLMTEKSTKTKDKLNAYTFEVDINSNKPEIKKAVESIFQVKVADVHTMIIKGKPKRYRFMINKQANWKKAVVTLKEGQRINI